MTPSRSGDLADTSRDRTHVIRAPEGYAFYKGRGAMRHRLRSRSEQIVDLLKSEFRRCGWPTSRVKVREVRDPRETDPKKAGVFYAHIGVLRGLDPGAVLMVLRTLPARCGQKRIWAELVKLPERVETGTPDSNVLEAVA